MKKKVLFIAYNFPPAGGAGVQRSLKFIKYLPQFDWTPIVITTTEASYPVIDRSLGKNISPATIIYRIKGYDIRGMRPLFKKCSLGKLHSGLNTIMKIPDATRIWSYLARSAVSAAVKQYNPDIIFSSSAPESAHLLGLWAKQTFNIPWVADFRDPWSENRLVYSLPGYGALNRSLERRVLHNADGIVTVSKPLAKDFERLSGRGESSVGVIENGYDHEDINSEAPGIKSDRFTITYTGNFTRLRRPDAFVKAIGKLIKEGTIPIDKIRIIFASNNSIKYIPDRLPYEHIGYVRHNDLGALRRKSNLFLLIQDDSPENIGAYSGKLFEYLGANRPTLAISRKENVAAVLIEEAKAGVVTNHDVDEIYAAVLHYYDIWQNKKFDYNPDWKKIQKYTRQNLTRRLIDEFEKLLS